MEKIKKSVNIVDKINEIIDWVNEYKGTHGQVWGMPVMASGHIENGETVIDEDYAEDHNRLKTLEDKVKFIMENSEKQATTNPYGEPILIPPSLQDLWDEDRNEYNENSLKFSEYSTPTRYGDKPTVKECDCLCHRERGTVPHPEVDCPCKPTDKSEKIEEVFDDPRDITELYNDGEIRLRKRTVNNSEKIEEIISEYRELFNNARYELWKEDREFESKTTCSNEIESWLRDKLKGIM